MQDYGLTYFLAKNVLLAVDEAFKGNEITPQAVFDALQPVREELSESLQHTDQILAGFERLGVKTDDLRPGDVEIAYTIPRKLREKSPSDLGKEFGEIEKLLKPFAEIATGETPEFEVRSISSSDFTIILGLNIGTVLTAGGTLATTVLVAKAVQMVAAAIREILGVYKDVVGVRRMRADLGAIDDTQKERDAAIIALQDLIKAKIDDGIPKAANRLCEKFNKIMDEERENELRNHLQINMRKIAALIDHGYDIETRGGEPPEPVTKEEEGEGQESIEESENLQKALEEIRKIHREQLTFEREGEPILSLPNPFNDETTNSGDVRVDENKDTEAAPTDRANWESRSSKEVVSLADKLMDLIREFDESIELKYNKSYVGLAKEGRAFNFVIFQPRKNHIILNVRMPKTEDLDTRIDGADIDTLDHRRGMYRLRITKDDLPSKSDFIKQLMNMAYTRHMGS